MFKDYWIQSVLEKGRRWLIVTLQHLVYCLMRRDNDREHALRLAAIRQFIYYELPLFINQEVTSVIEGGKYNYFTLPSGDLPRYDFVLPQLGLYVYVPNVTSADWEEARQRGISRDLWEYAQQDIDMMRESMDKIEFQGEYPLPPRLVIIPWTMPVNKLALVQQFKLSLSK